MRGDCNILFVHPSPVHLSLIHRLIRVIQTLVADTAIDVHEVKTKIGKQTQTKSNISRPNRTPRKALAIK